MLKFSWIVHTVFVFQITVDLLDFYPDCHSTTLNDMQVYVTHNRLKAGFWIWVCVCTLYMLAIKVSYSQAVLPLLNFQNGLFKFCGVPARHPPVSTDFQRSNHHFEVQISVTVCMWTLPTLETFVAVKSGQDRIVHFARASC